MTLFGVAFLYPYIELNRGLPYEIYMSSTKVPFIFCSREEIKVEASIIDKIRESTFV